jgi:hypothetical protein
MAKKKVYDARKVVRELARERVGSVPPARVIEPKDKRKPKHKRPPGEEDGFGLPA